MSLISLYDEYGTIIAADKFTQQGNCLYKINMLLCNKNTMAERKISGRFVM